MEPGGKGVFWATGVNTVGNLENGENQNET